MNRHNPFYIRELPLGAPFCNRQRELKELTSHAENKMNVVLFSPRRYGKTSLVKRVLDTLNKKEIITVYADLLGVTSVEDIANRLATKVYHHTHTKEVWFKKALKLFSSWRPVMRPDPESGVSFTVEPVSYKNPTLLLEETLKGLERLSQEHKEGCCVVFDEFQEITEIPNSVSIEGLMRSHIQQHSRIAYFFIGSRRKLLTDMFNERKRPFYKSALNYPLKPLPDRELTDFIIHQFKGGGKICPKPIAEEIVKLVKGYAYYAQKIGYSIYEIAGKTVTGKNLAEGLKILIEDEKIVYEMMLKALSVQQIILLVALAKEPTNAPFAAGYMSHHKLGSIGGVQGAIKKLISLDYIERSENIFQVVDPIFIIWLRAL